MPLNLNPNSVLQSLTAKTPDGLVSMIQQVRGVTGFQVIAFTANPGEHTCYFRCHQRVKIDRNKIDTSETIET